MEQIKLTSQFGGSKSLRSRPRLQKQRPLRGRRQRRAVRLRRIETVTLHRDTTAIRASRGPEVRLGGFERLVPLFHLLDGLAEVGGGFGDGGIASPAASDPGMS